MIEVEALSFKYLGRRRPALRDVSFRVERGESLLVLGPSGCGKSTLALALNGLIPHSVEGEIRGTVWVNGLDTREASPARLAQTVGMVFQDPEAQFCMLTVEEEVAFGLENLAVPRAEMDARIEDALDAVGLLERRRERIDRLSGGQKQRLALACVLAMRPPVLVLDEPTAQLDPVGAGSPRPRRGDKPLRLSSTMPFHPSPQSAPSPSAFRHRAHSGSRATGRQIAAPGPPHPR